MSSLIKSAVEISHQLLATAIHEGDTVLDATAGRGRDTCFLAQLVGEKGTVWAFDIQIEACRSTAHALVQAGLVSRVHLICDDHANLAAYAIPSITAAIFNLGWLPGSDRSIVSGAGTIKALQSALLMLKEGGILVVVAYIGHSEGADEYSALLRWITSLPKSEARCLQISFPAHEQAPIVLLIEKTLTTGNLRAQPALHK
ncbi:MAG: rRNA methyltransferase [Clostridiales bacterium]|nr:rRNA methyltransferase [Clostridiales bacterium]